MKSMNIYLSTILLLSISLSIFGQLSEQDRLQEYEARGYQWPLPELKPNTPGWRKIFDRRFEQIEQTIPESNERYNAWVQVMSAAFVQQNFTENGWGLTRAPEDLQRELKKKLHDNLATAPLETHVDVIEGGEAARPLFIENAELNQRTLDELKPMHEKWAGVDLIGEIAYGLRVYRNNSRLLMHVDKSRTHVISCILHIDHSEDSEPWPIVIEDFQGNTNEVVLESGDMLFYESSKCFHGRPHTFKGSWYSSIFVHYYPVDWDLENKENENHYAIPPHWGYSAEWETDHYKLEMVGTSMKEPDCENVWCALKDSVKWRGPAIDGVVITTGWKPDDDVEDKADEKYRNEL
mmetsp:Transcript_30016/g.34877  ORF Transcript_30016/g.34877 Transcript_30016/m.34877 type:complete len:350 (+) Transcript_30016:77-1126(+)